MKSREVKFSYLGDPVGSAGRAEEALRSKVRCIWDKFRELVPDTSYFCYNLHF